MNYGKDIDKERSQIKKGVGLFMVFAIAAWCTVAGLVIYGLFTIIPWIGNFLESKF